MTQRIQPTLELGSKDLETAINIIGAASDCGSIADLQRETLSLMAPAFNTETCIFTVLRHDGLAISVEQATKVDRCSTWNMDPGLNADYRSYFYKQDPFRDWYNGRGWSRQQSVVRSSDFVPVGNFVNSAFYHEFAKPHSIESAMKIGLHSQDGMQAMIGIFRPDASKDFDERDIAMANAVALGLTAALDRLIARERIAEQQRIIDGVMSAMPFKGLLVLDEDLNRVAGSGEIVDAPPGRQGNGHGAQTPFLPENLRRRCLELFDNVTLNRTAADHLECSELLSDSGGQVQSLRLRVLDHGKGRRRLMVFVEPDADTLSPDELMRRNGLTSREKDVAHLAGGCLSNLQIAETLGISVFTVQNHLRAIYRKLCIQGRTALVNRLAVAT